LDLRSFFSLVLLLLAASGVFAAPKSGASQPNFGALDTLPAAIQDLPPTAPDFVAEIVSTRDATTLAPDNSQPAQSSAADQQNPPAQQSPQAQQPGQAPQTTPAQSGDAKPDAPPPPQPKRIMGIMPNFRAVSAGTIPPPPTAKQSFIIATRNSFDYSSFFFVGLTSLIAEATNAHPQIGRGPAAYWGYYWRGFLDKTDGNYLVIFALPTVLHEDNRYYALGKGGVWKRLVYSTSRILVAKKYDGDSTFNTPEILGRAMAQGISASYYPSGSRTIGALSQKYAYALGRDALTNAFREFWPDIAVHVLHRHP
jgi:hypothetical protein